MFKIDLQDIKLFVIVRSKINFISIKNIRVKFDE